MDDFEGTYAPQSPDLSALHTYEQPQPDPFATLYSPPQQQPSYPPQSSYNHSSNNHDSFHYGQAPPHTSQNTYQPPTVTSNGRMRHANEQDDDNEYTPETSAIIKGGATRKAKKPMIEEETFDREAPGVAEGIEVKTKFPVARIKRIMQADDEVGKVAQVTPTAVSKALELFMISVVTKAANEARARSSKRVTAAHLKQAVEKEEQLDFLKEIVSKIPDAPAAKREKEEDSEEPAGSSRKKKGGTKRKKKEGDD